MRLTKVLPSMFHRRLLLLLAACTVAFAGLASQMARLTVSQGQDLLRTAESKLVRQRWTQTVRGRILDREGRVLAEDRPAFAAKVKYDIISGPEGGSTWARLAAASAARRRNTPAWEKLDDEAREELIGRYREIYEGHVRRMWERLASECGLTAEELMARRKTVERSVQRKKRSFVAQGLEREYRKQLELLWKVPAGREETPAGVARRAEIEARAASVSSPTLPIRARASGGRMEVWISPRGQRLVMNSLLCWQKRSASL